MKRLSKLQKGFTLIELLVVIAIIATLAVIVFVALDPATRLADARNSRRWNDVNSILTAVHESIVDTGGDLPTGLSSGMAATELGTCAAGAANCSTATDCVDLSTPLAEYLKTMPQDPSDGSASTTGYTVEVDANNLVTIASCHAENSETIEVSR
jgi:prepilin-type N-terminal cleavage/methylation domain-containing protein